MHPAIRTRLERNLAYHEAMAEHHGKLAEQEKQQDQPVGESNGTVEGGGSGGEGGGSGEGQAAPTSSAPANGNSQAAKIAELHNGVVQQLRDVLAKDPGPPKILEERANRVVIRRTNPPVRGGKPTVMLH